MTIQEIISKVESGELTTDQGNVEMVISEKYRIIRGRIDKQTRKALNEAVKAGKLGYLKKEKLMGECYYAPEYKQLAIDERLAIAMQTIDSMKKILI